jgi:hypothetical protein
MKPIQAARQGSLPTEGMELVARKVLLGRIRRWRAKELANLPQAAAS